MKNQFDIAELNDEEGIVYSIFLPETLDPTTRKFLNKKFPKVWNNTFDHADFIFIPGPAGEVYDIKKTTEKELQRLTYKKITKIGRDNNEEGEG